MRRTCFFLLLFISLLITPRVFASELDDINNQINEIRTLLEGSKSATKPLEETLSKVEADFKAVENNISSMETDIGIKQREISDGEKKLGEEKGVFDIRVRSYYKNSRHFLGNSIGYFVSNNVTEAVRKYFYQQRIVQKDRDAILKTAFFITKLEEKKNTLQQEQSKLSEAKKQLDEQKKFYESEVGKAKNYQSGLEKQISELVAQQQTLIAQRLSALSLPQSAYTSSNGCSSDLTNGRSPGFSPSFGFFTFGVPHRVGMSQYGAKGRAEAGQSAEQILKFYYNADYTTGYDTGINIHVVGSNEYGESFDNNWNIEEYLQHVYEMPSAWPQESLKAQVIAARSYVLSYTGNGSSEICPNQHCQVVKQTAHNNPCDGWCQAVRDTAGIVMTSGGSPISAYFSSTAGGYIYSSSSSISSRAWTKNAQDGNGSYGSFDNVRNNAYDKESPWFYCDWGSRPSYGGTAWMKSEEVADIVNVLLLTQKDQSTIANVYQVDAPNPAGKDTWDTNRVKDELKNRGGSPFSSVSSVGINADFGGGVTTSVVINGDAGTQTFSGDVFKTYFNQRAPANIQIVGPLFNVERR
ncbi:MAG: hypothetical protein NUV65_06570 [Candidatus Roizmanbacteria bacterium]|nr:hypothetical protein [Candidatus Roizmanbacteria bacterium]